MGGLGDLPELLLADLDRVLEHLAGGLEAEPIEGDIDATNQVEQQLLALDIESVGFMGVEPQTADHDPVAMQGQKSGGPPSVGAGQLVPGHARRIRHEITDPEGVVVPQGAREGALPLRVFRIEADLQSIQIGAVVAEPGHRPDPTGQRFDHPNPGQPHLPRGDRQAADLPQHLLAVPNTGRHLVGGTQGGVEPVEAQNPGFVAFAFGDVPAEHQVVGAVSVLRFPSGDRELEPVDAAGFGHLDLLPR